MAVGGEAGANRPSRSMEAAAGAAAGGRLLFSMLAGAGVTAEDDRSRPLSRSRISCKFT